MMPAASQPGDEELSFDVTEADFQTEVLERSLDVPVLLDCWAPWCGPCRSLKPVLEKLVKSYGGRFLLAKINTDEAPQLSAALRIRSIPLVVLFVGGRPVDQFQGALPEGKVREFLDRHLPPDIVDAEAGADMVPGAEADAPFGPLDEAAMLIEEGALDEAQALLDSLPPEQRTDQHARLMARLKLASHAPGGDAEALAARIAAHPKDFEARFGLAALQAHAGDFEAAFEQLLDVVLRDKAEHRERARKQLVEWFEACPDPALVSKGRRYLGMYLN